MSRTSSWGWSKYPKPLPSNPSVQFSWSDLEMPRSGIEDDRGQLLTYARTPQVVDLVAVARIWTARHHAHLGLALRRREPLRLPYLRVQRHDRLVARPAALWRLSLQFETVAKLSFHGHSHCARLRRPVGSVQSIAIDLKSFSDPSDDFPNVFFFKLITMLCFDQGMHERLAKWNYLNHIAHIFLLSFSPTVSFS